MQAFQRLVDAGHSVPGHRKHNLEVLKCADWILELGPEAGDAVAVWWPPGRPSNWRRTPRAPPASSCAKCFPKSGVPHG
ncbi:MAG: hypothetical protein KIT22_08035 [Verrucomicrobiae bacterium]|nr:hypothetical protein [Verrucomicrobiae bacterium]